MGQLREIIQILKKEYVRTVRKPNDRYSKKVVRSILRKYDIDALEEQVKIALDENAEIPHGKNKETELRKKFPGKYDVVFINYSTKEKQILTRKQGITYDIALAYYNYTTFFNSEKYEALGYYDILPHEQMNLPEEAHIGIF